MRAILIFVSVTALALSACQKQETRPVQQAQSVSNEQMPLYASVTECVNAGNTQALCQDYKAKAEAATPRFQNYATCEQQYGAGNCRQNGDWVGPAMMGFVIGNMLANNSPGYYAGGRYDDYDYDRGRRYSNRPTTVYRTVYRDRPATVSARRTSLAPSTPAKVNTRTSAITAYPANAPTRPCRKLSCIGGYSAPSSGPKPIVFKDPPRRAASSYTSSPSRSFSSPSSSRSYSSSSSRRR